MKRSPQNLAPSLGAFFVVRLLRELARLLGFPMAQPIPVRVRRRDDIRRTSRRGDLDVRRRIR